MSEAAEIVRNEEWFAFDSLGLGDGRVLHLSSDSLRTTLLRPSVLGEARVSSLRKEEPNQMCRLMPMWESPGRSAEERIVGGGGSFEEDGYVARFQGEELCWILFVTQGGPFFAGEVRGEEVWVTNEEGMVKLPLATHAIEATIRTTR